MEINNIKISGEGYLVNESIFVPNDPKNTDYQNVKKYIDSGGVVNEEFTTEEFKENLIISIKSQAKQRIEASYPDHKQRNLNGVVSAIQNKEVIALKSGSGNYTPTSDEMVLLRAAKACKDFIDGIRAKSNQLEASLDSMTEEQLNDFDPSNDSNWQ